MKNKNITKRDETLDHSLEKKKRKKKKIKKHQ